MRQRGQQTSVLESAPRQDIAQQAGWIVKSHWYTQSKFARRRRQSIMAWTNHGRFAVVGHPKHSSSTGLLTENLSVEAREEKRGTSSFSAASQFCFCGSCVSHMIHVSAIFRPGFSKRPDIVSLRRFSRKPVEVVSPCRAKMRQYITCLPTSSKFGRRYTGTLQERHLQYTSHIDQTTVLKTPTMASSVKRPPPRPSTQISSAESSMTPSALATPFALTVRIARVGWRLCGSVLH